MATAACTDLAARQWTRPYIIGVAGPSCAGKTELSRHLAARLSGIILPLDCYYLDLAELTLAERARFNFDVPQAMDHDLFLANLRGLAGGKVIQRPVYDFATHRRTTRMESIEPRRFIIVEGLFVLHWEDVRSLLSTKVFVDLEDGVCLERRLVRDVRERGRTPESVSRQFAETVQPMAQQYVRPSSRHADILVRGDMPIDASIAAVISHIDRNAGETPKL